MLLELIGLINSAYVLTNYAYQANKILGHTYSATKFTYELATNIGVLNCWCIKSEKIIFIEQSGAEITDLGIFEIID